jgi:tRNA threonylcarbamoyladenosine biosynthesis protein TsaB
VTSRILAVDTTTEFGGLALLYGSEVVEELLLHSSEGFGHILFANIERLLAKHAWAALDIDCFAAAAGPGTFTGTRVGLAAVKGLAETAGKPIVAVSNLAAVASFGSAPLRAAVLDARRGEIYGAVYSGSLELICPEIVTKFPAWLDSLPAGEIEFLSPDFAPFQHALAGTRFENAPVRQTSRNLAAAVGVIAARRFTEGNAEDPGTVDANYVRRSDAELFWKDR